VKNLHIDIGETVDIGDPLLDIAPDPTPLELAEAKRQVEINTVTFENSEREMLRLKELNEKNLISEQDYENAKAKCDETKLRLDLAKEKLALIQEGQTKVADRVVENVIKSPIKGTVLARHVDVGDPVVPLTSYQAGTELMSLADMSDLMFKGTVDEIDVGKLQVGMPVELKVGALPKAKVTGQLTKVSPKARKDEGSTVFDVEIDLDEVGKALLRAGYSANADIIIKKKEDILLIPERLVEFVEDSAFVFVQDSLGAVEKTVVETGLSDGIHIEIVGGIEEGAQLVEGAAEETES
jgi:HlyD family secretion protein